MLATLNLKFKLSCIYITRGQIHNIKIVTTRSPINNTLAHVQLRNIDFLNWYLFIHFHAYCRGLVKNWVKFHHNLYCGHLCAENVQIGTNQMTKPGPVCRVLYGPGLVIWFVPICTLLLTGKIVILYITITCSVISHRVNKTLIQEHFHLY